MPRASPLNYGVAGTWAILAKRVVVDASALLPLVLPDTPDCINYAVAVVERVAGGALDGGMRQAARQAGVQVYVLR